MNSPPSSIRIDVLSHHRHREGKRGAVAKCGACDFVNATKTHLTDCCIEALVNGIAAMDRAALLLPFKLAFASANPAAGGCAPVAPPRKRMIDDGAAVGDRDGPSTRTRSM